MPLRACWKHKCRRQHGQTIPYQKSKVYSMAVVAPHDLVVVTMHIVIARLLPCYYTDCSTPSMFFCETNAILITWCSWQFVLGSLSLTNDAWYHKSRCFDLRLLPFSCTMMIGLCRAFNCAVCRNPSANIKHIIRLRIDFKRSWIG